MMSIWQITNSPYVGEDSRRLDNQWKRYLRVNYDFIQSLHVSAERTYEEHRCAESNRNDNLYLDLINRYIASEEGIADVSKT